MGKIPLPFVVSLPFPSISAECDWQEDKQSRMWYFAYGSNLNSRAVAEWCRHYGFRAPAMKPGKPAVLDNYRLSFPIFSEYFGGGIGDIV
jgi:hypothetical protein